MKHLLNLVFSLLLSTPAAAECVILLHGLTRTPASMEPLQEMFEANGFTVANVSYPSREFNIAELAPVAVKAGLIHCGDEQTVHFVTHSLGGILVRVYMRDHQIDRLGRVVMIAPPNQGSEVVDTLRNTPGFYALNGPAGLELGTDENSVPLSLGRVDFEVGIIAGTRTFNPLLSLSLPNPDDGKVSVERTKVEGMTDFIEVPHSHPFIMGADIVLSQSLEFIKNGKFRHDEL